MEKRLHARVPTYKTATLFAGPNTRETTCFVMDISEGGAGLHVTDAAGIPDTFQLLIQGETERRRCKVAWKLDQRVGLSFLADQKTASASETSTATKRQHPRRAVSDRGKIVINRPFSMLECIVLDISEGGACIELILPAELPPAFDLVFADRRRPCAVAWQKGKRIGVMFT